MSLTKVFYKPDSHSTEVFIVFAKLEEYKEWKEAYNRSLIDTDTDPSLHTSIGFNDVVDSHTVFHSIQGPQGILGQASRQQLDTVFAGLIGIPVETEKDVKHVIEFILKNGKEQHSDTTVNTATGTTNIARGSADGRNKGKI